MKGLSRSNAWASIGAKSEKAAYNADVDKADAAVAKADAVVVKADADEAAAWANFMSHLFEAEPASVPATYAAVDQAYADALDARVPASNAALDKVFAYAAAVAARKAYAAVLKANADAAKAARNADAAATKVRLLFYGVSHRYESIDELLTC